MYMREFKADLRQVRKFINPGDLQEALKLARYIKLLHSERALRNWTEA